MENASYALQIAIGTLIAIMIISLTVFFWQKFGIMEKSKDDAQEVKNRSTFNAEWQAYEKNLMYGSDVLSCLNKAQNNNQKYVYNNYYGQDSASVGKESRDEYFVDVVVTIKSPLYEKVEAYWRNERGSYKKIVGGLSTLDADHKQNYKDTVFNSATTMYSHFDMPTVYYYYFKNGNLYQEARNYATVMGISTSTTLYDILTPSDTSKAGMIETTFGAGEYHLLETGDAVDASLATSLAGKKESAYLSALISTVAIKEQKLVNKDQPNEYTEKSDWWYCTWTTATNDFKSRKFKCTGLELDRNTGYVNKISFEEL